MEHLLKLKKDRGERFLTIEELVKLNSNRLLTFYKKERKRRHRFIGSMTCGCCGERMTNLHPNDDFYKEMIDVESQWEKYLKQIKEELNKREHVE